jgi:hypothetical protein
MNCFENKIAVILLPLCLSLFALDYSAQDKASSGIGHITAFVFPRAEAGGASAKKTTYRVKYQLPQRKASHKPSTGATGSRPNPVSPATFEANEKIGVTLWRLRPERKGDTGARLLTMGAASADASKMIAERVGLDTVLKMGEKVRISVESPRAGYLYVIDRELRRDGTLGDPYLIFPTLRIRGGDNKVGAGMVIEIPAQTDNPFYFDITPLEENYAGELLTVMVSPTRIAGLKLEQGAIKLSAAMVEEWENKWEGSATTLELEANETPNYTQEEKEAGTGTRQLTHKAPSPQTVISVEAPKGRAFLVSFPLKVSK